MRDQHMHLVNLKPCTDATNRSSLALFLQKMEIDNYARGQCYHCNEALFNLRMQRRSTSMSALD